MRVRLLRDWAGPTQPFTLAGAVVEVDTPTARQLFHGGIAEPVREASESAAVTPSETAVAVPRPKARRKKAKS